MKIKLVLLASVLLATWSMLPERAGSAEPQVDVRRDHAERLFALKVLPLLKAKCFGCQGDDVGDIKGELDVRSRAGLLKGGESAEPSLVPGKPEESPLYLAVIWDGLEMPPKDRALLDGPPAAARQGDNPIDAFLAAKLSAAGLVAAPIADFRTLIRRASYDLTGLPPTPDEILQFGHAWEKDPRQAWSDLITRLLASQHYGERWGSIGWTSCGTPTRRDSRTTTNDPMPGAIATT